MFCCVDCVRRVVFCARTACLTRVYRYEMASAVGATGVVLLVDAAVAVPTTGVWGWLGYTTITACPWVIPVALVVVRR